MTLKQLIQEHPQLQGESQRAYARRLAAFGVGTYNSLRCAIQSEMVTVKQSLKNGEVIGEVQKLVTPSIDIPDNFAIKRISTNINSQQQWVIAEPEKNRELTVEEIKEHILKNKILLFDVPEVIKGIPKVYLNCFDNTLFYFSKLLYSTNFKDLYRKIILLKKHFNFSLSEIYSLSPKELDIFLNTK
jgi:hypothetical protein